MFITSRTRYTIMDIWRPKYSTQYGKQNEWCILALCSKVDGGADVIVCQITKAKHIMGNRYCMLRNKMVTYPKVWNGKANCYEIPMSHFEAFETRESTLEALDW